MSLEYEPSWKNHRLAARILKDREGEREGERGREKEREREFVSVCVIENMVLFPFSVTEWWLQWMVCLPSFVRLIDLCITQWMVYLPTLNPKS